MGCVVGGVTLRGMDESGGDVGRELVEFGEDVGKGFFANIEWFHV